MDGQRTPTSVLPLRLFHGLALIALTMMVGACDRLEPPLDVEVELDSWLRIEGTTTVSSFICRSEEVYGGAVIEEDDFRSGSRVALEDVDDAGLRVPVHSLDCGRKAMNQDLYQALKVGAHPEIKFRLDRVEIVERPLQPAAPYLLLVEGTLTIAGVERAVSVPAHGRALADHLGRAYGRKRLLMSDFGIEPPTAMLGLIKVNDEIEVVFDVVGSASSGHGQDPSRGSR